jgi:rhomboid family GlyGly-CTERM serine protease
MRMTEIIRAGRRSGAPLVIAVAAVVLFLVPGAREALEYDRAAVAAGEVWRLLTCQLIHASAEHLFWDAAAVLILGAAVAGRSRRTFATVAGVSAVVIPLGVHFALPSLSTYCGLSGMASALFATFAATLLADAVRGRGLLLAGATATVALAFLAKIAYEATTGSAVFVDLGESALVPVPLAHLLGAVIGAACVPISHAASSTRRGRRAISGAAGPTRT